MHLNNIHMLNFETNHVLRKHISVPSEVLHFLSLTGFIQTVYQKLFDNAVLAFDINWLSISTRSND